MVTGAPEVEAQMVEWRAANATLTLATLENSGAAHQAISSYEVSFHQCCCSDHLSCGCPQWWFSISSPC